MFIQPSAVLPLQYLIPMLGMLLGNACSGVAVGLSTILDELSAGRWGGPQASCMHSVARGPAHAGPGWPPA